MNTKHFELEGVIDPMWSYTRNHLVEPDKNKIQQTLLLLNRGFFSSIQSRTRLLKIKREISNELLEEILSQYPELKALQLGGSNLPLYVKSFLDISLLSSLAPHLEYLVLYVPTQDESISFSPLTHLKYLELNALIDRRLKKISFLPAPALVKLV